MKAPKTKPLNMQSRRFVEEAHALGCDESEEHFDAALKKVAAHKSEAKKVHGKESGTKK